MSKKKKKDFVSAYVNVRLYSADVVLLVCPWKEVIPWIEKEVLIPEKRHELLGRAVGSAHHHPNAIGRTLPCDGGGSIIWLPKMDLPVLVHEVSHASYWMLSAKGIKLSDETDEVYAYLVEYIFKCLYVPT